MNMPAIVCAPLVMAAILLLAGPGTAKADAVRGHGLAEQWCSQCHGIRPSEPSANSDAPTFSAIAAEPSATPYALRTFLRVPHPTMPNFILKPDDIDDIVAHITSLKPQK